MTLEISLSVLQKLPHMALAETGCRRCRNCKKYSICKKCSICKEIQEMQKKKPERMKRDMAAKYKDLAARLADMLTTNVNNGIYRLPTEAELGRQYQVSRQTGAGAACLAGPDHHQTGQRLLRHRLVRR